MFVKRRHLGFDPGRFFMYGAIALGSTCDERMFFSDVRDVYFRKATAIEPSAL